MIANPLLLAGRLPYGHERLEPYTINEVSRKCGGSYWSLPTVVPSLQTCLHIDSLETKNHKDSMSVALKLEKHLGWTDEASFATCSPLHQFSAADCRVLVIIDMKVAVASAVGIVAPSELPKAEEVSELRIETVVEGRGQETKVTPDPYLCKKVTFQSIFWCSISIVAQAKYRP